eukprot:TRINITY_DN9310_c0_g1_i1.p1 TRINITY_DN9310_c0_g1~~TRINITY_DN9310_c0_g1_i1.p1  ORF type:complete len:577 (-),score=114.82 TRINITY_DN9310_c0_g1_i1:121-1779(-)
MDDFLKQGFIKDVPKRPSAEDLLNIKWITIVNQEKHFEKKKGRSILGWSKFNKEVKAQDLKNESPKRSGVSLLQGVGQYDEIQNGATITARSSLGNELSESSSGNGLASGSGSGGSGGSGSGSALARARGQTSVGKSSSSTTLSTPRDEAPKPVDPRQARQDAIENQMSSWFGNDWQKEVEKKKKERTSKKTSRVDKKGGSSNDLVEDMGRRLEQEITKRQSMSVFIDALRNNVTALQTECQRLEEDLNTELMKKPQPLPVYVEALKSNVSALETEREILEERLVFAKKLAKERKLVRLLELLLDEKIDSLSDYLDRGMEIQDESQLSLSNGSIILESVTNSPLISRTLANSVEVYQSSSPNSSPLSAASSFQAKGTLSAPPDRVGEGKSSPILNNSPSAGSSIMQSTSVEGSGGGHKLTSLLGPTSLAMSISPPGAASLPNSSMGSISSSLTFGTNIAMTNSHGPLSKSGSRRGLSKLYRQSQTFGAGPKDPKDPKDQSPPQATSSSSPINAGNPTSPLAQSTAAVVPKSQKLEKKSMSISSYNPFSSKKS